MSLWTMLPAPFHFNLWDSHNEFKAFIERLHSDHQHWIPILDAGIPKTAKDEYPLYHQGKELDVFIKREHGEEFVGEVWPGWVSDKGTMLTIKTNRLS